MAEPITLPSEEAPTTDEKNGSVLHALRELLSLPVKEGKKQLKNLKVSEQLELLDLVRASLSVADEEDDDFIDSSTRELAADLKWMHQQYDVGAFNDVPGQFVAVAHKQRLGSGPDQEGLREEVAAKYGIAPQRIVLMYIFDGTWYR